MLPNFRAKLLYAFRVALSMGLSALWVLHPVTGTLFIPGLLVPIGAVRMLGCDVIGKQQHLVILCLPG